MEKKDLKIVFLGTPEFAVESLRRIHEGGYNVVGVVTATDKPAGRGKHLAYSAVKEYALEARLPLLQPESLKSPEFLEQLRNLDADLFVVIAFRMLPEAVWQMPRLGTFNLHASLLPRYRGAAPINWAVINGDEETGVTTFFLKHEIDTGDVIDQRRIAIGPHDNVGDVYDRLMHLGADLTIETIDRIIAGNLTTTPQDELAKGVEPSAAPKIFKETCRIDWNKPARAVHNHVRGLSPYPGAWCDLLGDGNTYKIYATRVLDTDATTPGAVKTTDGRIVVDAADKQVEILSLQAPGKKRMSAADFLRGYRG